MATAKELKAKKEALADRAEARLQERREANARAAKERADHKAKMVSEHGLPGDSEKMADRVYALAWQQGHSNGYEEVAFHYTDIMEMFEDVKSITFN